jgi:hypothetical protein
MTSKVTVILRNPLNHQDQLDYTIIANDTELAQDWIQALEALLRSGRLLEKNFCFMGFPNTARTIEYLCNQLNQHIAVINTEFDDYHIPETFSQLNVFSRDYADDGPNHALLNCLHNHFERLQGTVDNLSPWYQRASYDAKYAIRQLNNLCHELESLILSRRKLATAPEWVRPSQITTWLGAQRFMLKPQHRSGFVTNGYNRRLGGVYMHWTQIGKTLFEVFRDEGAPSLTQTVCEAITHLQYYSGEFDIDWGRDVVYGADMPWHTRQQDRFREWLASNGQDCSDPTLSLGYLPLGQVDLIGSFGTQDPAAIWPIVGNHLDIYQIRVNDSVATFDYCWTDATYQQMQIDRLKPGYDYQSRRVAV